MSFTEEFKITGNNIVQKIAEILNEGNIRRLVLKNKDGKVLLDTTLTIASIGGGWIFLLSPIIATIAAIVMSLKEVTLEIERID